MEVPANSPPHIGTPPNIHQKQIILLECTIKRKLCMSGRWEQNLKALASRGRCVAVIKDGRNNGADVVEFSRRGGQRLPVLRISQNAIPC